MPNKVRAKWRRPFNWPPSEWEFTPGMQKASEVVTGLLFLLVLSTIVGAIFLWPFLLFRTITNVLFGSSDEIRNTLLAVGALIGVPFLIWRTTIAAKQTDISRESHYTALFTKAVEQLGADKVVKRRQPKRIQNAEVGDEASKTANFVQEYESYEVTERNYEVRLGAIYALERIAQDSKRDAWPINLTLCSYIANNAPPKMDNFQDIDKYNTSDIVEIFQVLCRYDGPRDDESAALFNEISIPKMSLFEGAFKDMIFSNCAVFDLTLISHVSRIEFGSCTIKTIFFQKLVNNVKFNKCSVDLISFESADVSDLSFIESTISEFSLMNSIIKTAKIRADWNRALIQESTLDDVHFSAQSETYNYNKNVEFINTTFKNCMFSNISFTNIRRLDCIFIGCSFYNCNIVGSSDDLDESNSFINCFDDSDLLNIEPDGVVDIFTLLGAWQKFRKQNEKRSPFDFKGY